MPRRHVSAGVEFLLGGDLTVVSKVLTNSSFMRSNRVFTGIGSGIGCTINLTSYLVKVTIPSVSEQ